MIWENWHGYSVFLMGRARRPKVMLRCVMCWIVDYYGQWDSHFHVCDLHLWLWPALKVIQDRQSHSSRYHQHWRRLYPIFGDSHRISKFFGSLRFVNYRKWGSGVNSSTKVSTFRDSEFSTSRDNGVFNASHHNSVEGHISESRIDTQKSFGLSTLPLVLSRGNLEVIESISSTKSPFIIQQRIYAPVIYG